MNDQLLISLLYVLPLVIPLVIFIVKRHRLQKVAKATLHETVESGLTEPPTLHPVFDPNLCFGGGACYKACPEKAIGIIDGKGVLISPAHCIGHGACAAACPVGAIKLVFGTETRGVDIPNVKPNFETNIPGIFIAGELGGMGLIRKAVEQGRQAMEAVVKRGRSQTPQDVVIVGAGPAGISATLAAKQHNLRCVTLEQEDTFGGTTLHYPRGKIVMTAPMKLPIIGKINIREISKESLMQLWEVVVAKATLKINFGERMEKIERTGDSFTVVTNRTSYHTHSVLLSIGRRGTPRKLDVPGEDLKKVVYRLLDPEQYRGKHVVVVGGGDAALEAAVSIANEPGTTVTLSYRSNAFSRVKPKNRQLTEEARNSGKLSVLLESTVKEIRPTTILLDQKGTAIDIPNDAVIVCAGGILPTPLLKEIGIQVETHHGKVA
ncbi:MAG: NAD(P)-binding domain-containing protein [Nitrosomonadales bacterium]|nr:NAD(P)-binding domain-containing protein [Nitrosomonadales bacterium]